MGPGHQKVTGVVRPWTGGASLGQLIFNWCIRDKHVELNKFEIKVTDMFPTKYYETRDTEKYQ